MVVKHRHLCSVASFPSLSRISCSRTINCPWQYVVASLQSRLSVRAATNAPPHFRPSIAAPLFLLLFLLCSLFLLPFRVASLAFLTCRSTDKPAALLFLLREVIPEDDMTIVFVATRHHAEFLHEVGCYPCYPCLWHLYLLRLYNVLFFSLFFSCVLLMENNGKRRIRRVRRWNSLLSLFSLGFFNCLSPFAYSLSPRADPILAHTKLFAL